MSETSPSEHQVLQQHALQEMQRRMRRWRLFASSLVVILIFTFGWQPMQVRWQQWQASDETQQTSQPKKLHTVSSQMLENRIKLQGEIAPVANVELNAPLNATVKEIHVRYGETVHQGDLLFELEPRAETLAKIMRMQFAYKTELQLLESLKHWQSGSEVGKARRNVVKQQQLLKERQRKLEEDKLLYQQGVIAKSVLESSEQGVADNQMMLEEAQKALEETLDRGSKESLAMQSLKVDAIKSELVAIREKVEQLMVYAPMDGILLQPINRSSNRTHQEEIKVGRYLQAGDSLAQIARMSQLRVLAEVDDDTVVKYTVGLKAKISSRTLPGIVLDGYTDSVSREPTQQGRGRRNQVYYAVSVIIPELTAEQRAKIRIGMHVEADIELSPPYEALVIPIDAVHVFGNERKVSRMGEGGTIEDVVVTTGVTKLAEIEIVHGLKAGDRIVLPEF